MSKRGFFSEEHLNFFSGCKSVWKMIKYSEAIKKNKASKTTSKRKLFYKKNIKRINDRWQLGEICNLIDKKTI